jgi:intracellular multiplication protein IcmT
MSGYPTKYDTHWRDSARRPRFFGIDARISLLLLFFLLHIRVWTFIITLVGISFLATLEAFGFTIEVFLRLLRNQLAGSRKIAIPWWIK